VKPQDRLARTGRTQHQPVDRAARWLA
jgi:hypothetical protein